MDKEIELKKVIFSTLNSLLKPVPVRARIKSLEIDKEVILVDYTLNELNKEFIPVDRIEDIPTGSFLNVRVVSEVEEQDQPYEIEMTVRIHVGENELKVESSNIEQLVLSKGATLTDKIKSFAEKWASTIISLIVAIFEIMKGF